MRGALCFAAIISLTGIIRYNSYYVGDIEDGEWLQYTIDVVKPGTYTLVVTAGGGHENGKISIMAGETPLNRQAYVLPAGMGRQKILVKNIHLQGGANRIRLRADKGGFKLFNIQIKRM